MDSVLQFYGRPPHRFFQALVSMEPQRTGEVEVMREYPIVGMSLGRALQRWWTGPGNLVLPPAALRLAEGLLAWSPLDRLTAQQALQSRFLQAVRDPTDEPRRLGLIDPHQNDQLQLHEWKGIDLLLHYFLFLFFII